MSVSVTGVVSTHPLEPSTRKNEGAGASQESGGGEHGPSIVLASFVSPLAVDEEEHAAKGAASAATRSDGRTRRAELTP